MTDAPLQPVFVCGCPRSGTTMLGAMLGGHPDVITVPESQWLIHAVNSALSSEGVFDAAQIIQRIARHWRFYFWGIELDEKTFLRDFPVETGGPCVAEIARRVGRQ